MEIVAFLKRLQSHSITPFFTSIHAYTQICPTEDTSSGGPPAWRRLETTPKLLPDLLEQFELPLYTKYYSILAGNSRRVFLSCFSNVQGLLFVVVSRSSSSTHSSSFPHPCKQGAHTLEAFYSQNSQFFNYYTFFFQVII